MYALWRHLKHSCFKIMFCMGVLDMMNLLIFCMADGVLGILGAVYCSAPDFMYIKGDAVMSKLIVVTITPQLKLTLKWATIINQWLKKF